MLAQRKTTSTFSSRSSRCMQVMRASFGRVLTLRANFLVGRTLYILTSILHSTLPAQRKTTSTFSSRSSRCMRASFGRVLTLRANFLVGCTLYILTSSRRLHSTMLAQRKTTSTFSSRSSRCTRMFTPGKVVFSSPRDINTMLALR
jgi:hypothetical protein